MLYLQFNITMRTLPEIWLFVFVKYKEFIATTDALTATEFALTVALNATGQNPGTDSFTKSLGEHDKSCKYQFGLNLRWEASPLSETRNMCEWLETANN